MTFEFIAKEGRKIIALTLGATEEQVEQQLKAVMRKAATAETFSVSIKKEIGTPLSSASERENQGTTGDKK